MPQTDNSRPPDDHYHTSTDHPMPIPARHGRTFHSVMGYPHGRRRDHGADRRL
jgi:hypothetical protein